MDTQYRQPMPVSPEHTGQTASPPPAGLETYEPRHAEVAPEVFHPSYPVDQKLASPPQPGMYQQPAGLDQQQHGQFIPQIAHQQQAYWQQPGMQPPQYNGSQNGFAPVTPVSGYPPSLAATAPPSGFPPPGTPGKTEAAVPAQQRRICGLSKPLFILIAVVATVVVLAIAIGAGVGVSVNRSHNSSGAAASSTTSSTPSSTPTPTRTSSTTSHTPTATEVPCPAANGTTYKATDSDKKFMRLCGVDYSGENEATDLGHVPTDTMDECIDACSTFQACDGAGWGPINDVNICYMKTGLNNSHNATATWNFAVLLGDDS